MTRVQLLVSPALAYSARCREPVYSSSLTRPFVDDSFSSAPMVSPNLHDDVHRAWAKWTRH